MKTTKFRREFCMIPPLRVFARVLVALCVALTFAACENPEFLGSPSLLVSAPIFADAQTGYAQVTTRISIQNTGNKTGYIKSISVSPATAFAIIGGGSGTVGAGDSLLRTVQLKSGLAVGTYDAVITVSYKGSDTSTATAKTSVSFTVTSAPVPEEATRVLDVTAPTFDAITIGAPRPVPQIIDIKNNGNSPATISSVTVSDTAKFTIGGSGSTVNGNSSIASWTVRPKNALGIGTHTATITVTYNGTSGTTATALVTFTVMPRDRYVAVNFDESKGEAAYSFDGTNWTKTEMPSNANWDAVAYGNGTFVALAESSGNAAYSIDGINWFGTTAPTPGGGTVAAIAFGGGKFVAVSMNSAILYSFDGITWTAVSVPIDKLYGIAYGNGRFVAVSETDQKALYSADGLTWTQTDMPSSNWESVTYGNGMFIAIGFNTSGHQRAAYSADGIDWTASTLPSSADWLPSAYGNGKFVALGDNSNKVAYSTDGINWTASTLPGSGRWQAVTFCNGKFIAVGNNNNAYSADGITWTSGTLPAGSWRAVAYGYVTR